VDNILSTSISCFIKQDPKTCLEERVMRNVVEIELWQIAISSSSRHERFYRMFERILESPFGPHLPREPRFPPSDEVVLTAADRSTDKTHYLSEADTRYLGLPNVKLPFDTKDLLREQLHTSWLRYLAERHIERLPHGSARHTNLSLDDRLLVETTSWGSSTSWDSHDLCDIPGQYERLGIKADYQAVTWTEQCLRESGNYGCFKPSGMRASCSFIEYSENDQNVS
jgi:hypothetical protein